MHILLIRILIIIILGIFAYLPFKNLLNKHRKYGIILLIAVVCLVAGNIYLDIISYTDSKKSEETNRDLNLKMSRFMLVGPGYDKFNCIVNGEIYFNEKVTIDDVKRALDSLFYYADFQLIANTFAGEYYGSLSNNKTNTFYISPGFISYEPVYREEKRPFLFWGPSRISAFRQRGINTFIGYSFDSFTFNVEINDITLSDNSIMYYKCSEFDTLYVKILPLIKEEAIKFNIKNVKFMNIAFWTEDSKNKIALITREFTEEDSVNIEFIRLKNFLQKYHVTLGNFKSSKKLKEDLEEKGYSSLIMSNSYFINEVEYIYPYTNEEEYSTIRIGYKVPFDVAIPLLENIKKHLPFMKYIYISEIHPDSTDLDIGDYWIDVGLWRNELVIDNYKLKQLTTADFDSLFNTEWTQNEFHNFIKSFSKK